MKDDDPIVMYLIVNESIGMSCGKTAAQCCHATQMLVINKSGLFDEWSQGHWRKVVLKANKKEWNKLKQLDHVLVVDAGFTEIPSGTETVIGLPPMRKSEVPKIVKHLQLLK